jgi:type II secretory pathway pseudopilin PulG
MTLIEVMLALSILVFALLAFSQALVSSSKTTAVTHELATAEQAAKQVLERIQAATFTDAFALYDTSAANDPGVAGSAPGRNFEVTGLDALPDDADGAVGEVVFPVDGAGILRENVVAPELGMPRDLNSDGKVDGNNRSGDYKLLPVLVRVSWRGSNGPAHMEIKTLLANY